MEHLKKKISRLPTALRQADHQEDGLDHSNDGDFAENSGLRSRILFAFLLLNLADPLFDLLILFILAIYCLLHLSNFILPFLLFFLFFLLFLRSRHA